MTAVRKTKLEVPDVVERDVDVVTLGGRSIRLKHVEIAVQDVTLNRRNPRIAHTIGALSPDRDKAQVRIEHFLWNDPDVRDLYHQVSTNGGLIERIIVTHDGTVIEGNCRTVVYRKLRAAQPGEAAWRRIPARQLPIDVTEREIAILLGEMHVAGKNTWSAFEKAGHVYHLNRDLALTQEEIARILRLSKSKVNQLVKSFDLMRTKYFPRYGEKASIRKFSHFEEVFRNPELRTWIMNDPAAEDEFVSWVGDEKLAQGATVRELAAIVANPNARQAMNDEGIDAAKRVLADEDPSLTSKLFREMREMTASLETARLDDIERVRTADGGSAMEIVVGLEKALNRFLALCDIKRR